MSSLFVELCHSISLIKWPSAINLISIFCSHESLTMLHIIDPLTFINHSSHHIILTDSMPHILFPRSIVIRSIRPCQFPLSIKFIIIIVTPFICCIGPYFLKLLITHILILLIWISILLNVWVNFRRHIVLHVKLRHKIFLIAAHLTVKVFGWKT